MVLATAALIRYSRRRNAYQCENRGRRMPSRQFGVGGHFAMVSLARHCVRRTNIKWNRAKLVRLAFVLAVETRTRSPENKDVAATPFVFERLQMAAIWRHAGSGQPAPVACSRTDGARRRPTGRANSAGAGGVGERLGGNRPAGAGGRRRAINNSPHRAPNRCQYHDPYHHKSQSTEARAATFQ